MLQFTKRCLRAPVRGGKHRSLTNFVNSLVQSESDPSPSVFHSFEASKKRQTFTNTEKWSFRISQKLGEGDFKGAVRLACSEDTFAEYSETTFAALKQKHPDAHPGSSIRHCAFDEPLSFPISTETIVRAIQSFPGGSSGGLDALRPQHIKDLTSKSAGNGGQSLLHALTIFVKLVLEGRTPPGIRPFFFGASLVALNKKGGGIRPIAIGSTLRRLASKCASFHALESIPDLLSPGQLGFGVPKGSEAAIHATRIFLNHLLPQQALVKIDFRNAFNSIRRDKMLEAVEEFIPALLPFVHSAYSRPSNLSWHDKEIPSAEGIQQGDPLGPLLFCLTIHKMVSKLNAAFKVFYLDDGTLGGNSEELCQDLSMIEEEGRSLGLHLNVQKCELICKDSSSMYTLLGTFPTLQVVDPVHASLLGSPLSSSTSLVTCLESKISQLEVISERLCHLPSHDALTLLRHSLALPKLLHILRTSLAFSSPLLASYDDLLRSMISKITNNYLNQDDPAWLQATLPIGSGGLGIRSAVHLAPSAFLASADGTSFLVQQILPSRLLATTYKERKSAFLSWKENLPKDTSPPSPANTHQQKAWDQPRVQHRFDSLISNASNPHTKARLLASSTKESGAWLNAIPVTSLGLRMSDETIRIAVGLRLGNPLCQPHQCLHCGSEVTELGTHGLSCRKSQGRHPRHNELNQVIHRSLSSAKIPSRLEPYGLSSSDRSRPDGLSMTPWSQGKFLVWDATCVDSFCKSNLPRTCLEVGAAAIHAEKEKHKSYGFLGNSYHFIPVAVETSGTFGPEARSFFRDLGTRIKHTSGDKMAHNFLIQRISVAIQRGNSMAILGTMMLDTPPI